MAIFQKYDVTAHEYQAGVADRVLQNLSNILNTKKGYGSVDPEFGIEDISHYTSKAMISQFIKNEIIRNLEAYYPQVEIIKISELPVESLSRIQLKLELRAQKTPVSIRVYNEKGIERWIVTL